MDYATYKARFYASAASLRIPNDCVTGLPEFVTSAANTWHFKWRLEFADGTYIRCRELWSYRTGKPARRHEFTYHYGPVARRDPAGNPDYHHSDPVVMRVDHKAGEIPHLHYGAPTPHYDQTRVTGYSIVNADMFQYLSAVLLLRADGVPLDVTLGFTVA